MAIYYSASTQGFYDNTIHAAMPPDAVQITEDVHRAMLEAQSSGKIITSDQNGRPTAVDRDPPTSDQVQASLEASVQAHMDERAQQHGYDSIFTAVTYADEPAVPQFQAEGQALRAWRSQVWAACYAIMAEVQAGNRAIPSSEELIALLPDLVMS